MGQKLIFSRSGAFRGEIRPPSDKSLTHRAYMFAAIAKGGTSVIHDPLKGEDCESTLDCLEKLGAKIERVSHEETRVSAIQNWNTTPVTLDCGNSGTTMRLLSGILAGQVGVNATLVGDESLSKRPMGRISAPLLLMGAEIAGATPPVTIHGRQLKSITYESSVASAQVKSAVLLAGLKAEGRTTVTEPALSRDHTERMFNALGVKLIQKANTVLVDGDQSWDSFTFRVPGDISSAAFFAAAAALHPGSQVTFQHLGLNPSRTGILDVLEQMGIRCEIENLDDELGEPVGNVTIQSSEELNPFVIEGDLVPRLIDEIPVLAVLATQCQGETVIRDAKELRVKETDRIAVVSDGLKKMGANVTPTEDGMIIIGPTPLHGATIDSAGDHRIGMSFAIAASIAEGETTILNADAIHSSYPEFEEHFTQLTGQTPLVVNT
ncbi:MAG: 3-phosphoshikimate 1-carboxyvinyltransferase [Fimbriimonadaceae bacterium]|nr:MAG: 3-phosphoshikimate 1-carboxyvinyltransferase [Fimbriimonadaceae bacterium]